MLVTFLIAATRYLTRSKLRRNEFILAHGQKEYSLPFRGRHGSRMQDSWSHGIHSQVAERNKCWC